MSDDELLNELSAAGDALRETDPRTPEERDAIASAVNQFDQLVRTLVARQVLKPGDRRLLSKIGPGQRVQFSSSVDKHQVASPDVDCLALLHLCKGRCCSFRVPLSRLDVVEGRLRWNLDEPYLMERGADGYCTHMRDDGGCGCYHDRPAVCREYDCREDRRIWIDFERRIPAPMLPDIRQPRDFPPPADASGAAPGGDDDGGDR